MPNRQEHAKNKSHNPKLKERIPKAGAVFAKLEFLEAKQGGANEGGKYGGIYKDLVDGCKSMVKQENDFNKNISEFIGSKIFRALSPGYGAEVSLLAPESISKKLYQEGGIQDNGANIYVQSKFFRHYSNDMYKDMDKHMSPKTKPSFLGRKDGRALFMGTREVLANTLTNAFQELQYQDFEKIAPASLLIGDFDIHTGNIGVIRNPHNLTELPRLVRIDFAASLNKLEDEIHPHSISRHLPFIGPTNHYREFPDFLKKNDLFADSVIKTAEINLDQTIDEVFKELTRYYNQEALAKWAQKTMDNKFSKLPVEQITVKDIKARFKEVMQKRQQSLAEYGLQIKLSIFNDAKIIDENKLKQLILDHLDYFNDIFTLNKGKKLKKRFNAAFQFDKPLSQILMQMITKLFYMIIKEQEKEFRQEILSIAKATLQESPTPIKNTEGSARPLHTQRQGERTAKQEKIILPGRLISDNELPPVMDKIASPQQANAAKPIVSSAIKENISPSYLSNIIPDTKSQKKLHQEIIEVKQNITHFISSHNKSDEDIKIVIEEVAKNLEKKTGHTKIGLIKVILQDHSISAQQKIMILQEIAVRDESRRNALIEEVMAVNPQSINDSSLIGDNVKFKHFIFENIDKLNSSIQPTFAKTYATGAKRKTKLYSEMQDLIPELPGKLATEGELPKKSNVKIGLDSANNKKSRGSIRPDAG